uniref:Uncharacterized protein n=1 Tax=Helianthus annuus TaxID=4232 RepID=A0A251U3V8_HELAN
MDHPAVSKSHPPVSTLHVYFSLVLTETDITLSFLIRFTRFFFLRVRNLILHHMELKSDIRINKNLRLLSLRLITIFTKF